MLRLLARTAAALNWAFRLALAASIGLIWNAYSQSISSTAAGTESSYSADIQQALAGLKELARLLQ
ncbi:MAG: hypothetical protein JOZ84_15455 [Methylobacteriaceae bacterium]|nr:hypothetical protein [Methylobacteriaceae bacterium]